MRSARELSLRDYVRLLDASRCIVNPTREQLLMICPHLTEEQVERTLMRGEVVALPPLKIGTILHVANYFPAHTPEHTPELIVCSINRLGERHFPTPLFWEEAKAFASMCWPDEIVAA
jgi:hypothetical protein